MTGATKPCRACGEEIAAPASLCHHCGTPQKGPLWLFQWKDLAGAGVAVLALLPWFAGFYAFVWPKLSPPEPDILAVVNGCERLQVSLDLVNTGDAFGFVRSLKLVSNDAEHRAFDLVLAQSGPPLGDKGVIAAGQVLPLELLSVTGPSRADQALPRGGKCALDLVLVYSDKDRNERRNVVNCACDEAGGTT